MFNQEEFMNEISNIALSDVEERVANLEVEVRGMNVAEEVAHATEKLELLQERAKELRNLEERKSQAEEIGEGQVDTKVLERGGVMNQLENQEVNYRNAYLKQLRGMEMTDVEQRAFTSATASAGAVIPTVVSNEIIKKIKEKAPLLDEITLLHVAGNVSFAVEGTKADAGYHKENANIAGGDDNLVQVMLSAFEITKMVQVSKTVQTMSIGAFETWLTDMIADKVCEKIGEYLINGTGASQPTGVEKANVWGADNSVTVTGATTTEDVLALIGMLPGVHDKNAKFLMSKKTLFTVFMPLQDASKNKIVTNEGNNYFIFGYPVLKDDTVALGEAYLGDFKKIVGNLSENINIVNGFDINTNSFKYLGCAMFDSKVADGSAFVKLAKGSAPEPTAKAAK